MDSIVSCPRQGNETSGFFSIFFSIFALGCHQREYRAEKPAPALRLLYTTVINKRPLPATGR
jgi:hypothetical protein